MPRYKCKDGTIVRSQFEKNVLDNMIRQGREPNYEPRKITYTVLETRTYTPDLILPSGVWVELKGWLRRDDKVKLRRVIAAYPTRNFCILFQKEQPHRKGATTTNIDWARKVGLIAEVGDTIPGSWYDLPIHRE